MTRFALLAISAFVVTFLAVHFLVLAALPSRIMSTVRTQMVERGLPLHHWQMSPQVTPETQTVVRPSPDLAYTICLIDLTAGPVLIEVPTWPDYGSLSIFDANTDNIYVGSLDARLPGAPAMRRVILGLPKHDLDEADAEAEQITLKRPEALALIRRLAPTRGAWEEAATLTPESRCGPV
ncbi:DUF1254 domain-containing protein [Hyphomonas sp.]|uniref:DUF1254 domain-containing protein n=1 Tax=Hyphomonas sp. TaxID=87 RepID=UPI00391D22C4